MDPVEKAIRNALEKGDAGNAAFRLRIYQAAQAALEKALGAGTVPAAQAQERKARLRAIVASVESEFAPATAPEPSGPTAPSPESEPRIEPEVAGFARHPGFDEAPAVAGPEARNDERPRERPAKKRRSEAESGILRRAAATMGRLFVLATVLALLALGAWWAIDTGLFKSASERDTSVPNPPAQAGEEEFTPKDAGAPQKPGEADAAREWITIFAPRDPTSVDARTGASAEVIGNGEAQVLRIASSTGEAAVAFDVGEGVLERLSGGKAIFDIIARSREGEPTQIAVICNFAGFGDCGRKRYEATYETGEFLFEIQFPDEAPGGGGTIAVVSDVSGGGKALDVVQIRAARAE